MLGYLKEGDVRLHGPNLKLPINHLESIAFIVPFSVNGGNFY